MSAAVQSLQVYENLAGWYDRQGQAKLRDWFLMLAADTALALGEEPRAESFRKQLLHVNPHHLLKPFKSFSEALKEPKVRRLIADLRNQYPPETAEQLFKSIKKKHPEIKVVEARPAKASSSSAATRPPNPQTTAEPRMKLPTPKAAPKPAARPPKYQLAVKWTRPTRDKARQLEDASKEVPLVLNNEPETDDLSIWVSTGLAVVTLVAGVALALVTFAGPYVGN